MYAMDKASLKRFFLNDSNQDERRFIIDWLLNPENNQVIHEWMKENWNLIDSQHLIYSPDESDIQKMWLNIQQKIHSEQLDQDQRPIVDLPLPKKSILLSLYQMVNRGMVAAAMIAAIVFSVVYFWGSPSPDVQKSPNKTNVDLNDVAAPKSNNAVLTLADGTVVDIENAGNGQLASQGNMKVVKNANGEIVYKGSASDVVSYNTLSIPRGSKPIRLVLSDGSIVWLNAASSIKYPTAFIGSERKVSIKGEAYFEVAKNKQMPFLVSYNDIIVKVLGTHFNINAYEDETDVKVTLLEGAVHVSQGLSENILHPGQQAKVLTDKIKVQNIVNLDEVMSWKNDLFYFNGVDIKTIMRQVEKYYNVQVEFKDEINYQFVAKISRNVNISKFLETLEITELVHFKIENGKIIVTK